MTPNVVQARELRNSPESWPALPLESWEPTRATLHMWTQIVGKVRLALTPLVNHWWNVPLYVSARGLTTSSMPYRDLVGGTIVVHHVSVIHRKVGSALLKIGHGITASPH